MPRKLIQHSLLLAGLAAPPPLLPPNGWMSPTCLPPAA